MTYRLKTPRRSTAVKKCVRQSFPSMMKSLLTSETTNAALMAELEKLIHAELKGMSKLKKTSAFMDRKESLLNFNWELIWSELMKACPVLMKVISIMLSEANDRKSETKTIACFIAAMVLKKRDKQLSFVQRAISILLYGHGTAKQVCITFCQF